MPEQPFTGSLKPGVTLDKYEIRERTAVGGMAIVYKAYDATLDRYVAVKQIAPHLSADEKFAARFRVEAQTLARLSSSQPNIVHVHELIQHDGQLYLVMEYVEGTTLRSMMDRGPVPLQTGLGVLLSTALGLRAMHAQGIVHRDLTPSNIMMAKDGALKITDFGLIGHSGGKTSLPMGTTKYMAPEMFTGAPVDPRADLYSLGMIAYEMLAGPEKFGDAFRDVMRDEKAQQVRWMHWHSNIGMRAPPLKDLQPGIPPLISKIIERLMDKEPSRRFASADQVVRWLRKIFVLTVQGKSITVSDSESMEREMEAEASPSLAPAAAPAAAPAMARPAPGARPSSSTAVAAPAETAEKTAPLPKPKWALKHWLIFVVAPSVLIVTGAVLAYWRLSVVPLREHTQAAAQAQEAADAKFNDRKFADAALAYERVAEDYRDLRPYVETSRRRAAQARAEDALLQKDWPEVDRYMGLCEKLEVEPGWTTSFKKRFQESREIGEKQAKADAFEKAGKYQEAIASLQLLVTQYPRLKQDLNPRIVDLTLRIAEKEYGTLMEQGDQALKDKDWKTAAEKYLAAGQKIDKPDVQKRLAEVMRRKEYFETFDQAEKAFADKNYGDAAAKYKRCNELFPSPSLQAKEIDARVKMLLAQAHEIIQSGAQGQEAAAAIYQKILDELDPKNPEAISFIGARAKKQQLSELVKETEEFYVAGDWVKAKRGFTKILAAMESPEPAVKDAYETKIKKCDYSVAFEAGTAAMAKKDYPTAIAKFSEAQAVEDTQEVKDNLKACDIARRMQDGIAAARQLMEAGQYLKADDRLKALLKIQDSPEVRELMKENNYRRFMERGKAKMAELNWTSAAAEFKMAQGYKDTVEVQGLIKKCHDMEALEKAREKKPPE
jgi:serine/threonine protein kinase